MRRMRLILLLLAAALAPALLSGCQRTLFAGENTGMTQFEAYDRMRGDYRPKTEPDVFGTPQPALRARLGRRD